MQQKSRFPGGEFKFPEFNFQNISRKTVYMIIAGIIGIWIFSGIYRVNAEEEGVVRRFGKYVSSTGPGLHYHLPWPFESVDTPNVSEIQSVEIGFRAEESLMLTGDNNIVDLGVIIQFRIKNAVQYLFEVRDPIETVRKASESAIRSVIARNTIDDALTENKTAIQEATLEELQSILDSYNVGIFVQTVNLQDVQPPQQVAEAFRDVASAIQDRSTRINEAEGYRNIIIPQTRGEAEQMIRQAEGYREQRIRRSQGDAARFLSVLEEYNKAKNVTRTRLYIETMIEILPGIEKYIIQSGGNAGVLNLLNLNKGGGQ